MMVDVVPDPDAPPEQEDKDGAPAEAPADAPADADAPAGAPAAAPGEEAAEEASPDAAEALAAAPAPASEQPADASKAGKPRVVMGVAADAGHEESTDDSGLFSKGEHRGLPEDYYQLKGLMTHQEATKALARKAALRGDLAKKRQAQAEAQQGRAAAAIARKEERRRRDAIVRIQARERGRRALRYVKVLQLQAWALEVVQRGVRIWVRKAKKARAEKEAKLAAERERLAQIAAEKAEREAARQAMKEEEDRLREEKEAEHGASRRRAKQKGEKEAAALRQRQKHQRDRAAAGAQQAARQAKMEEMRSMREREERSQQEAREKAENARRALEDKQYAQSEVQRQEQNAKDEAIAAVRRFAEDLQELAAQSDEHSEYIRQAGGIPPLVAMLEHSAIPQIENAAALALTHVSKASDTNRDAIRHAGGFAPLISLAAGAASSKTGADALDPKDNSGKRTGRGTKTGRGSARLKDATKYISAITNLAMGTNLDNQDAIREAGGIPLLVSLLPYGPDSKHTGDVVSALRSLTHENSSNCDALREAGGVPWMVSMLQTGPSHPAATDAAATLTHIAAENSANQDAVREAGGIRPLIALLAGDVDSQGLVWGARCLAALSENNTANRNVICEQQGTLSRLVTLLASGASSEGAREAAQVLRTLLAGHDDRIAMSVLAAMKRQGVGLGQDATFTLSDEYPELLKGLTNVVGLRLNAAVKKGTDRGHIQMALNDAIALEMPEESLAEARAWLESIAVARAEAVAARKAKRTKKETKSKAEDGDKPAARDRWDTVAESFKQTRTARSNGEGGNTPGDGSDQSPTKRSNTKEPSGATTLLLEAQNRLRNLEIAAAAAHRMRRNAAEKRAARGETLTPNVRIAHGIRMQGAIDRMVLYQQAQDHIHAEERLERSDSPGPLDSPIGESPVLPRPSA